MKYSLILLFLIVSISSAPCQDVEENFEDFFFKFSTDSAFQISRIKFPLEFHTWKSINEIGTESVIKQIEQAAWKHDYFFMNHSYRPQFHDNFQGNLRDTDERLFQWIGIETGLDIRYYFKRKSGLWYLIKKDERGN